MARMSTRLAFLVTVAVYCTVTSGRELLAPVPAPAPGPSVSYTVPNWVDGVRIANASLPVGGTLVIPWRGEHGVYETASYSCPDSFPIPNPNGLVGEAASQGSFSVTYTRPGVYYYVCQVGAHCADGQLIAVTVS